MKVSKAIEILALTSKGQSPYGVMDTKDAVKLGIEALKRHKSLQENPHYTRLGLLPSETEED